MKVYVLESYGWFDDIAEEIRKDYKKPLYETAADIKAVKEIAKDYGKIHTTHDQRYATKLAIKKEWEEQTKEVNEYNGNLGYDD